MLRRKIMREELEKTGQLLLGRRPPSEAADMRPDM